MQNRPVLFKCARWSILVSRSQHRPRAEVYLFGVRDVIPSVPTPLRPDEPEPVLPLNRLLHELYDQGGYDLILDYQRPPQPPLAPDNATWARQLLAIRRNG